MHIGENKRLCVRFSVSVQGTDVCGWQLGCEDRATYVSRSLCISGRVGKE